MQQLARLRGGLSLSQRVSQEKMSSLNKAGVSIRAQHSMQAARSQPHVLVSWEKGYALSAGQPLADDSPASHVYQAE